MIKSGIRGDWTQTGFYWLNSTSNRGIGVHLKTLEKYIYIQWEMNEKRRYMGRILKTEQNLDLYKHRELVGSVSATQSAITGTGN